MAGASPKTDKDFQEVTTAGEYVSHDWQEFHPTGSFGFGTPTGKAAVYNSAGVLGYWVPVTPDKVGIRVMPKTIGRWRRPRAPYKKDSPDSIHLGNFGPLKEASGGVIQIEEKDAAEHREMVKFFFGKGWTSGVR